MRHVQTLWEDMVVWVLGCELVLSSSLHGVIFAEAFGVPARWVQRPGSTRSESWFKYVDYYSAYRPALARAYARVRIDRLSNATNSFPAAPVIGLAPFGVQPASTWEEGGRMGGAPGIEHFDAALLLESFPRGSTSACPLQKELESRRHHSPARPYLIGRALACDRSDEQRKCKRSIYQKA